MNERKEEKQNGKNMKITERKNKDTTQNNNKRKKVK